MPDETLQSTVENEHGVTRRSALKGVIATPIFAGIDRLHYSHGVIITPVDLDIDIMPDGEPNTINIDSNGTIPVAILGGDGPIDVTEDIDVDSLRFGHPVDVPTDDEGLGAAPAHGGHVEDVDEDGDDDLVVHFPTQDAGFEGDEDTGHLVGQLHNGDPVVGSDSVNLVGQ